VSAGDTLRTMAFYARVLPLLAVPPLRGLARIGGATATRATERALLRLANRLFSQPIPVAPFLSHEAYFDFLDTDDFFTLGRRLGLANNWIAGRRVLDAGCGHGKVSLAMLKAGAAHVTGLDIAASSIAFARQQAGREGLSQAEFLTGSIYELPFPQDHFDDAVSQIVFEHLDQPAQALREVHRVLKPGGRFFFTVDSFRVRYGAHLGHFMHVPWPCVFFTEDGLTAHWMAEWEKVRRAQPDGALPDFFDFSCSLPSLNRLTMAEVDRIVADSPFELERALSYADEKLLLALLPWQRLAPRAYEYLRGSRAYLLRKR
jgi:SAM-dependent methyltransferase